MKTDKELLELAAKACGFNVKAIRVDSDDNFDALIIGKKGTKEKVAWNPLLDNNDAMPLLTRFRMDINQYTSSVEVAAQHDGERVGIVSEEITGCRLFATRRAIVRAAAAIGGKK